MANDTPCLNWVRKVFEGGEFNGCAIWEGGIDLGTSNELFRAAAFVYKYREFWIIRLLLDQKFLKTVSEYDLKMHIFRYLAHLSGL